MITFSWLRDVLIQGQVKDYHSFIGNCFSKLPSYTTSATSALTLYAVEIPAPLIQVTSAQNYGRCIAIAWKDPEVPLIGEMSEIDIRTSDVPVIVVPTITMLSALSKGFGVPLEHIRKSCDSLPRDVCLAISRYKSDRDMHWVTPLLCLPWLRTWNLQRNHRFCK